MLILSDPAPPLTAGRDVLARLFLGCPFRHQGRARNGLDCAGLVVLVERLRGRTVRDVLDYPRTPHQGRLLAVLRDNYGDPVEGPIVPGDVLLMSFGREPQHVAIASTLDYGEPGMIHTYTDVKRVTEHRLDARWSRRVVGIFR